MSFLKPFIPNPGILDATPSDPLGYVTNDGMWAAVPCGKKFMIIHNGSQVKALNTYCLLYTSPSPRDKRQSRMPSSA